MTVRTFDVLVAGGGITGLAFALLLSDMLRGRRSGLTVGVLEAAAAPQPQLSPQVGLRVIALSPASRAILETCGAWRRIPAQRLCPYERMVVWQHEYPPDGRAGITFSAAEEGVAALGYIVGNDFVRRALWSQSAERGVELMAGTAPVALIREPGLMSVRLADGRVVQARLVVGADGATSWLRGQLHVPVWHRPYGQCALVAHVKSERPHAATAWQRFLADGPVALLPLADGRSSVVWSCPEGKSDELIALPEETFNHALTEATAGVLGKLQLSSARAGFRLEAGHAAHYSGPRFALIGDAAHRIHPLAGQGVNLGLLDAATLAETLADNLAVARADPGDLRALRRFERRRKGPNLMTLGAMEAFHRVFTSRLPSLSRAGAFGMGAVNECAPVKHRLARHAMGLHGELPAAASAGQAH